MAHDGPDPIDVQLRDPLSDVTRKERRNLLAVGFVAIVIAKAGLVPTEISSLGIHFAETDQSILLKALAAVVLYFLSAFTIYAWHDYVTRGVESRRAGQVLSQQLEQRASIALAPIWRWRDELTIRTVGALRSGLDFGVPILVGAYAIYCLWRAW